MPLLKKPSLAWRVPGITANITAQVLRTKLETALLNR